MHLALTQFVSVSTTHALLYPHPRLAGNIITYTADGGSSTEVLGGSDYLLHLAYERVSAVRMIRSHRLSQSPYAPLRGLRYDGVYNVSRMEHVPRSSGSQVRLLDPSQNSARLPHSGIRKSPAPPVATRMLKDCARILQNPVKVHRKLEKIPRKEQRDQCRGHSWRGVLELECVLSRQQSQSAGARKFRKRSIPRGGGANGARPTEIGLTGEAHTARGLVPPGAVVTILPSLFYLYLKQRPPTFGRHL